LNIQKNKIYSLLSANPFFACLDSCNCPDSYGTYDWIIAAASSETETCISWENAEKLISKDHWWFGILGYDSAPYLEPILSPMPPKAQVLPEVAFFKAEIVCYKKRNEEKITILGNEAFLSDSITNENLSIQEVELTPGLNRSQYLEKVEKLKNEILDGNVYEINLTCCFSGKTKISHPEIWYLYLKEKYPTPMSMLFKFKHLWMIGNSPERFLQKTVSTLISQPIKGTIARGKTKEQDQEQIESLKHSEKNQAENVMIVDLVRNDLNRCCIPGSVQVPELFGIHSFSKVHHMISTISGELEFPEDTWKPLRDTFPPGSMTGAPKIMAMELITREEPVARGWYSGATGYFTPEGDFDFAVVIRSFIYDSQKELLTYNSGGAITWDSDPKEEYEEMLVKASAVLEGLTSKTP